MSGWIVASLSASGWRFMWIRPRRAMTHVSWITPRAAAGSPAPARGGAAGGAVVVVAVIDRPPRAVRRRAEHRSGSGTPRRGWAGAGSGRRRAMCGVGAAPRPSSSRVATPLLTGTVRVRASGSIRGAAPVTSATTRAASSRRSGVADHDVEVVAADLALELAGVSPGDDAAVVDDDDVVGQALGLVQVLGGQQQRRAPLDQVLEHRPQLGAGAGIETGRGLVEEQDLGVGHERGGQVEAPAHAPGVARGHPVGRVDQRELLEQASGLRPSTPGDRTGGAGRASRGSRVR